MNFTTRVLAAAILLAVAILPTTVLGQGLYGSTVEAELRYPTFASVIAGPLLAPVDTNVEFPPESLVPGRTFAIDVTDSQIFYYANETNTYGTSAFNGFTLDFTGAPTISSVTLDGLSTFAPVSYTWDANTVVINLSGLSVVPTDQLVFNVNTVPESSSIWMLGGCLGAAVVVAARRRSVR